MTTEELQEAVWKLIDDNSRDWPSADYVGFLLELADDAKIRVEAVAEDQQNQEGGE